MRHTRGHTRNRRSHHALKGAGFILCADCGHPKLKHITCSGCGKYKGKVAISEKVKGEKSAKKVAKKAEKKTVKKTVKAKAKK